MEILVTVPMDIVFVKQVIQTLKMFASISAKALIVGMAVYVSMGHVFVTKALVPLMMFAKKPVNHSLVRSRMKKNIYSSESYQEAHNLY